MNLSFKRLEGMKLHARDGDFGAVKDVLFDDQRWFVRWIVVDTGGWMSERLVLLAPDVLERLDGETRRATVACSRAEIEAAPEIDVHKPVSRQREQETMARFGWTPAWVFTGLEGEPPVVPQVFVPPPEETAGTEQIEDPHLRSAREVKGYAIRATDGDIGHVDDLVLDDEGWTVRYLVVDTRNLLPGRKVLLAPDWISRVGWEEQAVSVDFDREEVRSSPEYHPDELPTREYERRLYDHYERPPYWR